MKKYLKAKPRYFPVLCGVKFAAKGMVPPHNQNFHPASVTSNFCRQSFSFFKKHNNNKIILAGAS